MTPQGDAGVTGPATAQQGGNITVTVESGDSSVTVSTSGTEGADYPVPSGGSVTVPVPPAPPGTIVVIAVGKGNRKRTLYVQIIAPGP
jgi:hypothetical protein